MSEDWASSVSVVVLRSSEGLSNDPGEILPELVLGSCHLDHIEISSFFNIGLDFVLSSLKSHFKSFPHRGKDSNESRSLTVEKGLGGDIVSSEASLLLSKSKLSGIDSSSGGRSEGGHSVGSIDRDVSGDLVANPLAVWLDTISMGLSVDIWVESNDSSVIDELLEVSNLSRVVWATWAESIDFSLEVTKSLCSTGDQVSLHFCEIGIHGFSVKSDEIGESLEFSSLVGGKLVSVGRELLNHFVSDGVKTSDELIFLVESLPDESLSLVVAC